MIRLVIVSNAAEAIAVAAAFDAGLLDAGPGESRRVLVTGRAGLIPEICPPLDRLAGFEALAGRFGEVISWDEEIAPLHPAGWMPPREELPLFERLLRKSWGLGREPVELVAGSVVDGPARTIAAIFHDAPVTVCCPDLMAYGPTMRHLPVGVGSRITRLLHLDLVPGLEPLLLGEYGLPVGVVPAAAYRGVVDELAAAHGLPVAEAGGAVIVGDPSPGLLRAVAAQGHRSVVSGVPAEVWFASVRPDLVVGASPAELFTARRFYGLTAVAGGVDLLESLTPYENHDRIPLTIADALLPRLAADGSLDPSPEVELAGLVKAVAYCMRAVVRAELRTAAASFLAAAGEGAVERYFDPDRLAFLRLPGRPEPPPPLPVPAQAQPPKRRAVGRRLHRALRRADVEQGTYE